jgi:hypothetical protein
MDNKCYHDSNRIVTGSRFQTNRGSVSDATASQPE